MVRARGGTVAAVWISGGTGLLGARLAPALGERGLTPRLLTRRPERLAERDDREVAGWDGKNVPPATLAGTAAAIHLSGEPLFGGVPTAARRARIRESRVASTRSLVDALGELPSSQRPAVLLCASATGYYGDRGEEELDEEALPGAGFLADLCRDWEAEAARAEEHGVRCVSLRIGVVLAREGGALALMAPIFRLGLGGRLGSGRQWFSWIHAEDLTALTLACLDAAELRGPINAVAPGAVRNAELTAALGRVLRRPAVLPVPSFALRAALGEIAGELLGSRRVDPVRARELGLRWRRPELEGALRAELKPGG